MFEIEFSLHLYLNVLFINYNPKLRAERYNCIISSKTVLFHFLREKKMQLTVAFSRIKCRVKESEQKKCMKMQREGEIYRESKIWKNE